MKALMKTFIVSKSLQTVGRGLVASALLTACTVYAADTPATSETTQGAGAARLISNPEESHISTSGGLVSTAHIGDAKSFLREAMEGNRTEIALAQIAERQSQNAEVKQFAQMMRRDHEQANQQLQTIAQAHGVAATQATNPKHQKKLDRFQALNSAEFDKEYMTEMLKGHQKDIAKYENASRHIKETDVQQYAQTTLSKLRQHLQHAAQTARTAGVDQATISSILNKSPGSMGGDADAMEKTSGTSGSSSESTLPGEQHAPQGPTSTP